MGVNIRREWGVPLYWCDSHDTRFIIRELNGQTERGIVDLTTGKFNVVPEGCDPFRKDRVHVANVYMRDNKFFVVLSDGSQVPWGVWITMTQEERWNS
jgi:hypothetical protein